MRALALLLAVSATATATTPSRDTLGEYVQVLAPRLTDNQAHRFGRLIFDASARADLDPMVLAAIVRQESNFRSGQKVCYVVHRHHACFTTCDYGLAQLNQVWVDKWHLDEDALIHDDAYNLRVATRVLNVIRKQFGDEDNWWSRYNTSGPHRAEYEASLSDYLAQAETSNAQ